MNPRLNPRPLEDALDSLGAHPDEWYADPVQCKACGNYYDLDDLTRFPHGLFCQHCADCQEAY